MHTRVLDYLDAFDCLVDAAEVAKPDLIIFCGDAFRSRSPNPTLVTLFSNRIIRLANIAPVVMIVGNHDAQSHGKSHSIEIMADLDAAHKITVCDTIEGLEFDSCYVITLPSTYHDLETVYDGLERALAGAVNGKPVILAAHSMVEGAQLRGYMAQMEVGDKDLTIPLDVMCADTWDYVALGHVHVHQCLCLNPSVVYSGSIERIDWGERDGPKGFILADIEVGKTDWRFVDVMARKMMQIDLRWGHIDNLQSMDVTDAIVRVIVDGVPDNITNSKVIHKVSEAMPDGAFMVDAIEVPREYHPRESRVQALHTKTMYDLLGIYFKDKHPDNPKWCSKLMKTAKGLVQAYEDSQ
jgi:exonuclease SbcD